MMVVLALLSLILGVFASLVSNYSRTAAFGRQQDEIHNVAVTGLEMLRRDVARSSAVSVPNSASLSNDVQLTVMAPTTAATRFTSSFVPGGSPVAVHYYLNGPNLMRQSGSDPPVAIAGNIDGLSAAKVGARYDLNISISQGSLVRVLSTSAWRLSP